MIPPLALRTIHRYQEGSLKEITDNLVVEEPLLLRLNGEPYQILMHLPGAEQELVLGFLLTDGVIRSLSEVRSLEFHRHDDSDNPSQVAEIRLVAEALARRRPRLQQVSYSSGGLGGQELLRDICRQIPPVSSPLKLAPESLLKLMSRLPQVQPVFQATGGTHAVALADPEGSIFLSAEDVGRHNAMDKAIGMALLKNLDLGGLVALLSGRISFEMALKAIRAGLPVLAGVSAPTSLAVELAQRLNLTLAGFVRGQTFNLYTHPQRLKPGR